jgi:hypothetical protein
LNFSERTAVQETRSGALWLNFSAGNNTAICQMLAMLWLLVMRPRSGEMLRNMGISNFVQF